MVSNRYVVVVGCGRLGSLLANRLSSLGSSVVVIDRKEAAFENLSTEFSGFRVTGDAAELAVLRQARTEKAGCLLAITSHDNVNLMVAQVAQTVFNVPQVMARVNDPSREAVYREFGIETICPTNLTAAAFLAALRGPAEAR
ncbi:MAG: TrkA family potassium uptake protein [Anaerolineae bacterium]|nr:TrkA family potassium uptake protein [Anaerolineae bacterium]